jgi:hypothetical protein
MGTFKDWLHNEIALGSDGMRDNATSQTSQATQIVGDFGLNNQKFDEPRQAIQGMVGNPSVARDQMIKMSSDVLDLAPATNAKQTNGPLIADYMAKQMGMPKLFPKSPALTMRKLMRKRMRRGMEKQ